MFSKIPNWSRPVDFLPLMSYIPTRLFCSKTNFFRPQCIRRDSMSVATWAADLNGLGPWNCIDTVWRPSHLHRHIISVNGGEMIADDMEKIQQVRDWVFHHLQEFKKRRHFTPLLGHCLFKFNLIGNDIICHMRAHPPDKLAPCEFPLDDFKGQRESLDKGQGCVAIQEGYQSLHQLGYSPKLGPSIFLSGRRHFLEQLFPPWILHFWRCRDLVLSGRRASFRLHQGVLCLLKCCFRIG